MGRVLILIALTVFGQSSESGSAVTHFEKSLIFDNGMAEGVADGNDGPAPALIITDSRGRKRFEVALRIHAMEGVSALELAVIAVGDPARNVLDKGNGIVDPKVLFTAEEAARDFRGSKHGTSRQYRIPDLRDATLRVRVSDWRLAPCPRPSESCPSLEALTLGLSYTSK